MINVKTDKDAKYREGWETRYDHKKLFLKKTFPKPLHERWG